MVDFQSIIKERYPEYAKHPLKDNIYYVTCGSKKAVVKLYRDNSVLESEFEILQELSCTGFVCSVLNKVKLDSCGFLELEYFSGPDLRYPSRSSMKEKYLITRNLVDFYIELEKRNIIYFDLQADHVISTRNSIKILDFGNTLRLNSEGYVLNTVSHCFEKTAAPEMLQLNAIITNASNVYSMSCLIYFLYVGNYYFDSEKYEHKKIPHFLCQSLQTGLNTSPINRPHNIRTFKELIQWI